VFAGAEKFIEWRSGKKRRYFHEFTLVKEGPSYWVLYGIMDLLRFVWVHSKKAILPHQIKSRVS